MVAPPDTVKKAKPIEVEIDEETIPDSLLHPRWKVQRTTPITYDDLKENSTDLIRPENMRQTVEYNDSLDRYIIGYKIGKTYVMAPIMMTPEEYRKWTEKRSFTDYYRSKNQEILKEKGKDKFDFTDMHFSLGPAEKIFGPGGVRIKTQGSAELKFGANIKNIDNPSLPIRNRKTTAMDFDEKINVNVNGKVGDKVNMNLNYNTDATFDFDTQNFKLRYEGKEDEIIKLVEGGNVTFPSNNSLVQGASALFGIRTDMQFGKLKLQTVLSQKKSSNKSVSSRGGKQLTPFEIDAADYEENHHFFLSQYFRDNYDAAMKSLPNLKTGVTINRVEVWVTNKTGTTSNTRNIVALTDLGENKKISRTDLWGTGNGPVPTNNANTEYTTITQTYPAARNIDQVTSILDGAGLVGGNDYEKLANARLLNSSEYTINNALGYISLKSGLQTDQVLAIAYEYTYGGVTLVVDDNLQMTDYLSIHGTNEIYAGSRNVSGEILAFCNAIVYAVKEGATTLTLIHDYEGIYKLATKGYKKIQSEAMKKGLKALEYAKENGLTTINFIWVNSHKGFPINELADHYAKKAVGLA